MRMHKLLPTQARFVSLSLIKYRSLEEIILNSLNILDAIYSFAMIQEVSPYHVSSSPLYRFFWISIDYRYNVLFVLILYVELTGFIISSTLLYNSCL